MTNAIAPHTASLWRRLGALIYDGFLLFAILIAASALTLPFTGFKGSHTYQPVLTGYFLLVIYVFFAWFWTHGGQTLGMRAWKIRLLTDKGECLSWKRAALRFLISAPVYSYLTVVISLNLNLALPDAIRSSAFAQLSSLLHYSIFFTWIVIDHWPLNWRDTVLNTQVIRIQTDQTPV